MNWTGANSTELIVFYLENCIHDLQFLWTDGNRIHRSSLLLHSFFSRVISILGNFLIAIFLNGAYCVMTYVSFCLKSSFSCLKSCFWRIVPQKARILTQNILDYGSNRSNKAAYYVIVFINLNTDTILWKLTAKRSYSSVLRTYKNSIML